MDARKVFISYSWSDQEHQARVLALAERLQRDGVDVVLDKWDLKHGQDTVVFMEQMVTDTGVAKVLVLIDRTYSEKADCRRGGVGTESQIISKEVYDCVDQTKFLPLVFDKDDSGRAVLPAFFKSRFYFDFSTPERAENEYPHLLRAIFDKPLHKKPVLGTPPAYILADETSAPVLGLRLDALRSMLENDRPATDPKIHETLEMLTGHLDHFRIEDPPADRPLDEIVLQSISEMFELRDTFLALVSLLARYRPTALNAERLHEAFARIYSYTLRPEREGRWSEDWADNIRFFLHELFLSSVALLLKLRCEPLLIPLLSHDYYIQRNENNASFVSYGRFRASMNTLERRNQRLKLNLISMNAQLLKERCNSALVRFEEIVQADFVLFLRTLVTQTERWSLWYPTTIVYSRENRPQLFTMAESNRFAGFLFSVLGVRDKADLLAKYSAGNERFNLRDQLNVSHWPIQISRVANLENLATRP